MRYLILTLAFACLTSIAFAQLTPVKWSFEAEKVNDIEYDIIITANIENGWSVYSQYLESQNGPVPTSFQFYDGRDFRLVGKTDESGLKKESFDDLFGMTLVKYSKKAKFTQRIKVAGDADSVKGNLTYMTCDATSCLPPTNLDFDIALNN